jgi:hypothetical protein
VAWSWGAQEQAAFEALKKRLTSAPVMAHPDFTSICQNLARTCRGFFLADTG